MELINQATSVSDIVTGVGHFIPDSKGSRMMLPHELLSFHLNALKWFAVNGVGFSQLLEGPKSSPRQSFTIYKEGSEPDLDFIDFEGCKRMFGWTEDQCKFIQEGIFHKGILKQVDAYNAVRKITEGATGVIDEIIQDFQEVEKHKREQRALKWKNRGMRLGIFIKKIQASIGKII